MDDKLSTLVLSPEYFGPFWKYVKDDNVTDVDFNGTDLWITDTKNRRIKIENSGITSSFINDFSQRVANQVSKPFNKMNRLLEAETDTLRISILHESSAVSGRSVCLRKTLPMVRITAKSILRDNYCPRDILNLLTNCVKAKMNFTIGGEPGAGKDLADDTFVPVPVSDKYPNGWARHGDLKPGDQVYAPDGSVVEIDYVTPGRDLNLYEVEFSDGQVIKASDTHLWRVSTSKARRKRKMNNNSRKCVDDAFEAEQTRLHTLAELLADSMTFADAETIASYVGAKPNIVANLMNKLHMSSTHLSGRGGRHAWPVDEAIVAWADHLAKLHDTNARHRMADTLTLSTKELSEAVTVGDGRLNWAVEMPEPIDGPDVDLPLDPYVLGAWLGDGHSYSGQITIFDTEIEQYINEAGFIRKSARPTGQAEDVTFDGLWATLRSTLSFVDGSDDKLDKRIPAVYQRASKAQRLALLQGLMDADGSIDAKGRCELSLTKKDLAEDALELIRSMGIKAQMHDGEAAITVTDPDTGKKIRQSYGLCYRINFTTTVPVFRVERKADRLPTRIRPSQRWNYIVAIRKVPSERGRCIHVVHPEHMYLAGGFVPTHNTEFAKFISQFIPSDQRVITIEDSPEWHFREINPGKDCVEMRVDDDFPYWMAIKTCLRQNPKWIMLSEARGQEVVYLLQSWSTGVNGITTIHTDDIRKIPSRMLNMMPTREDADRLENDIYDFVNVALLVRRKQMPDGTAHRYIDQMGFLYRDGKENKIQMLVKNGEVVSHELPRDIAFRLERADIINPFECPDIDKQVGDTYHYSDVPDVSQQPVQQTVSEPKPAVASAPTKPRPMPKPTVAPKPVMKPTLKKKTL